MIRTRQIVVMALLLISLFACGGRRDGGGVIFRGVEYFAEYEVTFDFSFRVVPSQLPNSVKLDNVELFGNVVYPIGGGPPDDIVLIDIYVDYQLFYQDVCPCALFSLDGIPEGTFVQVNMLHLSSGWGRSREFDAYPGGESSSTNPLNYLHTAGVQLFQEAPFLAENYIEGDELEVRFPLYLLVEGAQFDFFELQVTMPGPYPNSPPITVTYPGDLFGDFSSVYLDLDRPGAWFLEAQIEFYVDGVLEGVNLPLQAFTVFPYGTPRYY
ncbi:MAG: hypothetical protein KDD70_09420 [Bdellovibrionales bacterium]|nr:hypothetical protein [Bdellovibrionales bacterium]